MPKQQMLKIDEKSVCYEAGHSLAGEKAVNFDELLGASPKFSSALWAVLCQER
jgi:hypothetical protein